MRRGRVLFVLFNIIISAAVAFGVITLLGDGGGQGGVREVPVTFVVRLTQPPITPQIIIITPTPEAGTPRALDVPDELLEGGSGAVSTPVPTLDPDAVIPEPGEVDPNAELPEGCITYTVLEGDFPGTIAAEFGVSVATLLAVNGLDEDSARFVQIDDVLIIPLENCPLDAFITDDQPDVADAADTPADTPEATEEAIAVATTAPTATATPRATVTLPPTAVDTQIALTVLNPADITLEQVEITNNGATVNILGWTLSDGQDNTFTFGDQILFSNATIFLRTRSGTDTPTVYHWNRDTPVFEPGDVMILQDTNGAVQAAVRVP